jgi:F-type H+-transporting ATPase subunit alpha
LDPITQKKIARGKRMVEMLKQNLNSPLEFYEQALLIYAGINGYLDTLDLDLILPLEKIFNEKLATTYKDMTQKIVAEKKLTDEVEEFFKKVIAE